MFQVGPLELLVVGIIALLVLGPQRLPDAARAFGKGVREFRGALDADHDDDRDTHAAETRADDARSHDS
jgi:sec-independent protein translocase protein TatA